MTPAVRQHLDAYLRAAEQDRPFPYDDATGLAPNVRGALTIGVGRNLTDRGLSYAERALLLDNDINLAESDLLHLFPWTARLDEVRYCACLELAFSLGATRLAKFAPTFGCLERGEYAVAADRLLRTKWARDVHAKRANRVADLLRTGTWSQ